MNQCPVCHKQLSGIPIQCDNCKTVLYQPFCPKCNAPLDLKYPKCMQCGEPYNLPFGNPYLINQQSTSRNQHQIPDAHQPIPVQKTPSQSHKRKVTLIFFAVAFITVLLILFLLIIPTIQRNEEVANLEENHIDVCVKSNTVTEENMERFLEPVWKSTVPEMMRVKGQPLFVSSDTEDYFQISLDVMINAGEYDIYILPKSNFQSCATNGYFLSLDALVENGTINTEGIDLSSTRTTVVNESTVTSETHLYGIPIDDLYGFLNGMGLNNRGMVMAIAVNNQNEDNIVAFFNGLLQAGRGDKPGWMIQEISNADGESLKSTISENNEIQYQVYNTYQDGMDTLGYFYFEYGGFNVEFHVSKLEDGRKLVEADALNAAGEFHSFLLDWEIYEYRNDLIALALKENQWGGYFGLDPSILFLGFDIEGSKKRIFLQYNATTNELRGLYGTSKDEIKHLAYINWNNSSQNCPP